MNPPKSPAFDLVSYARDLAAALRSRIADLREELASLPDLDEEVLAPRVRREAEARAFQLRTGIPSEQRVVDKLEGALGSFLGAVALRDAMAAAVAKAEADYRAASEGATSRVAELHAAGIRQAIDEARFGWSALSTALGREIPLPEPVARHLAQGVDPRTLRPLAQLEVDAAEARQKLADQVDAIVRGGYLRDAAAAVEGVA